MPCYDAPPPFEDEERKSAENAVRILCSHISSLIGDGVTPATQMLEWWIEHLLFCVYGAGQTKWNY